MPTPTTVEAMAAACGVRTAVPILVALLSVATVLGAAAVPAKSGDTCGSHRCRPGRVCQVAADGKTARCVCADWTHCLERYSPVCGSNGRRYRSHCDLHRHACTLGQRIRPAPISACHHHHLGDSEERTSTTTGVAATMKPNSAFEVPPGCPEGRQSAADLRDHLISEQCPKLLGPAECTADSRTGRRRLTRLLFASLDVNRDGVLTSGDLTSLATDRDQGQCSLQKLLLILPVPEGGVSKEQFAMLMGLENYNLWAFSKSVTTKVGERLVDLNCDIRPMSSADRIQWLKNGIPLRINSEQQIDNFTRVLRLRDATSEDAGLYRCRSSIYRSLYQNISLSVITEPAVRVHPSMLVRRAGQTADFYCDTQGSSQMSVAGIQWFFDAEKLQLGHDRKINVSESGHKLHIAKLDRNHTGIYSCRVENIAGSSEFAGSLYVRNPTETDLNSYPISSRTFDSSALLLHSGGVTLWDSDGCSGDWDLSADWDATLCENLLACEWGPVVSAGRQVYAAQPSLGRLLRFSPGGRGPSVFEIVQLNCPATLITYDPPADRVWVACADGRVFTIDTAAADGRTVPRLAAVWREPPAASASEETVLALPDRAHQYVVVRTRLRLSQSPPLAKVVVSVLDRGGGRRAAFALNSSDDDAQRRVGRQMATVVSQGGVLLLYSSGEGGNASGPFDPSGPPIVAVDLRTGRKMTSSYLPDVAAAAPSGDASQPRGRLFVSPQGDLLFRVAGSHIYAYRVQPNGQLGIMMQDVAAMQLQSVIFHRSTDGKQKILAPTDKPGSVLVITLEDKVFQLAFDKKFADKSRASAPSFGDTALVYSNNSAAFFNSESLEASGCGERLFVQLQGVHWLVK